MPKKYVHLGHYLIAKLRKFSQNRVIAGLVILFYYVKLVVARGSYRLTVNGVRKTLAKHWRVCLAFLKVGGLDFLKEIKVGVALRCQCAFLQAVCVTLATTLSRREMRVQFPPSAPEVCHVVQWG